MQDLGHSIKDKSRLEIEQLDLDVEGRVQNKDTVKVLPDQNNKQFRRNKTSKPQNENKFQQSKGYSKSKTKKPEYEEDYDDQEYTSYKVSRPSTTQMKVKRNLMVQNNTFIEHHGYSSSSKRNDNSSTIQE